MSRIGELEHTADIGFELEAGSVAELFRLAAVGLARAVGAEPAGEERREETLELAKPDLERLLVAWLRELLHRGATEREVAEVVDIEVEGPGGGEGGADPGEPAKPGARESAEEGKEGEGEARLAARLEWRPWAEGSQPVREIKGVTYHGLEVRREGGTWHATVVLDV